MTQLTDTELNDLDTRGYITTLGINAEKNAKLNNETVKITHLVVDGGLLPSDKSPVDVTELVHDYGEQAKFSASVVEDDQNEGGFIVQINITADHHINNAGYKIWGLAAVTDKGIIHSYRRVEGDFKTYNPDSSKSYTYRLRFLTSNAEVINYTIDPTIVIATMNDLDKAVKGHEAKDDPHPNYWHNDETATQAQAEEGIHNGVIMTALRSMQLLKSRISDAINGTRSDFVASEKAVGQVRNLAVEGANNKYIDIVVGGDANTYYPVSIGGRALYMFSRYSISRHYSWAAPDTWHTPTHRGGLTLSWEWAGDGIWGGNDQSIRIIEFHETYSLMVAGMQLSTGGVVVWLRGGGSTYRIHDESGLQSSALVHLEAFSDGAGTSFPLRVNTNNVQSEIYARFPIRGEGNIYHKNASLDAHLQKQTNKNLLLNGNFKAKQRPEVTQRQIGGRTYAPFDRWGLLGEGNPTVTIESSENRPLGEFAPDSDVMQVTATAVSHSGFGFGIYNWLEDGYKATRGKKVTVSYFIQADSAMDLLCGLHIPSSNTANNVTLRPDGESIAVTTEWKRHSFTVTIPNVIDATGHMVCEFHSRAGQAWDKVRLCGVQVEVNDMATDVESRTEGVELFLCQRYFEPLPSFGDSRNMFSLILANSHPFAIPYLFKVKKRVPPTMSAVNVHCNASIHNWEMVSEYGCQYQIMQNATLGDTNTYMYVYGATADADF